MSFFGLFKKNKKPKKSQLELFVEQSNLISNSFELMTCEDLHQFKLILSSNYDQNSEHANVIVDEFFIVINKQVNICWTGKIKVLTTIHRMIIDIGEPFSNDFQDYKLITIQNLSQESIKKNEQYKMRNMNIVQWLQENIINIYYNYLQRLSMNQQIYKICIEDKQLPEAEDFKLNYKMKFMWLFKILNIYNFISKICPNLQIVFQEFNSKQSLLIRDLALMVFHDMVQFYDVLSTELDYMLGRFVQLCTPDAVQLFEILQMVQPCTQVLKDFIQLKEIIDPNNVIKEPSWFELDQEEEQEFEAYYRKIQLLQHNSKHMKKDLSQIPQQFQMQPVHEVLDRSKTPPLEPANFSFKPERKMQQNQQLKTEESQSINYSGNKKNNNQKSNGIQPFQTEPPSDDLYIPKKQNLNQQQQQNQNQQFNNPFQQNIVNPFQKQQQKIVNNNNINKEQQQQDFSFDDKHQSEDSSKQNQNYEDQNENEEDDVEEEEEKGEDYLQTEKDDEIFQQTLEEQMDKKGQNQSNQKEALQFQSSDEDEDDSQVIRLDEKNYNEKGEKVENPYEKKQISNPKILKKNKMEKNKKMFKKKNQSNIQVDISEPVIQQQQEELKQQQQENQDQQQKQQNQDQQQQKQDNKLGEQQDLQEQQQDNQEKQQQDNQEEQQQDNQEKQQQDIQEEQQQDKQEQENNNIQKQQENDQNNQQINGQELNVNQQNENEQLKDLQQQENGQQQQDGNQQLQQNEQQINGEYQEENQEQELEQNQEKELEQNKNGQNNQEDQNDNNKQNKKEQDDNLQNNNDQQDQQQEINSKNQQQNQEEIKENNEEIQKEQQENKEENKDNDQEQIKQDDENNENQEKQNKQDDETNDNNNQQQQQVQESSRKKKKNKNKKNKK